VIRATSSVRQPGAPETVINAIACYRTNVSDAVLVRPARPEDGASILMLVDALAAFEKLTPPTGAARERLIEDIFGPKPRIGAWLAELEGQPVAYALVYDSYSSFLARPKLYLEDIFVLPEFRGRKVGYALFAEMMEEARRRGCAKLEWTVLDWNQHAIEFYERLGAKRKQQWFLYQLEI
jgi:GNAT superfamily N-acetyltransferase